MRKQAEDQDGCVPQFQTAARSASPAIQCPMPKALLVIGLLLGATNVYSMHPPEAAHTTTTGQSPDPKSLAPREFCQDSATAPPRWTERWQAWGALIGAGCTVLILIVTATYTAFTKQQADSMRAQLGSSTETFQLTQRAWLGISRVVLVGHPTQEGSAFHFRIAIINTGPTPALHVTTYNRVVIAVGAEEPAIDWPDHPPENSMLVPGQEVTIRTVTPQVSPEIASAYAGGSARIYVLARVEYRDIFGNTHWTEVCKYHVHGNGPEEFHTCYSGNGIDI